MIVTSCVIALALILGLVGTSWQAVRATRASEEEAVQRIAAVAAREEEAIARRKAEAATLREEQARRQIRRNLYVADMNRVGHAWDQANDDIQRNFEDLQRELDDQLDDSCGCPDVPWDLPDEDDLFGDPGTGGGDSDSDGALESTDPTFVQPPPDRHQRTARTDRAGTSQVNDEERGNPCTPMTLDQSNLKTHADCW